jgi:Flp pilus assembly protein TadG
MSSFVFAEDGLLPVKTPSPNSCNLRSIMSSDLARSVCVAIARFLYDKTGAAATIVAIALPGLIGIGALGVETGVWFTIKLQNQSAADSAAISAAYEVIAGRTNIAGELTAAADEAARRNGYKGVIPTVVYPYTDGAVTSGVAVTLQQTQGALLATMFLSGVTVANTAVAVIEALDTPCILALGSSGTDVQVAEFAQLEMSNCSVVANSTSQSAIELNGSASSISADTLVTVGEISLNGNPIDPAAPPPQFTLSSPALIGAPKVADPYAGLLTHSFLVAGMPKVRLCTSSAVGGIQIYQGNCVTVGASLTQGSIKLAASTQISGGWSIQTGQTVDLSPGTYWVTGDLTLQSGAVLKCSSCDNTRGAGVTIILIAYTRKVGAVSIASGAMLNLSAPRSGPFAGLVIVQDSNQLPRGTTYTSSHSTIGGNPGASLNGLVYSPNSSLTFHGTPSSVGPKCLLLVSGSVNIDLTTILDSTGCAAAGLTNLPMVSKIALAE